MLSLWNDLNDSAMVRRLPCCGTTKRLCSLDASLCCARYYFAALVRIGLTMRLECTGPRCPRTHFHLSQPCFSSDAKREPSSRSVYIAAPVQMGFRSIPFITLHTHPIEATRTKGEWLCVVHITRTRRPHAIAGKQDWME